MQWMTFPLKECGVCPSCVARGSGKGVAGTSAPGEVAAIIPRVVGRRVLAAFLGLLSLGQGPVVSQPNVLRAKNDVAWWKG